MMYPRLKIDIKKLVENTIILKKECEKQNINLVFVGKVFNSDPHIMKYMQHFSIWGDSYIENLKKLQKFNIEKMLLRAPSFCEIKNTIKYANISLNSELTTIQALNKEAKKQNKIHKILLMIDVGDLREGYFYTQELLCDIDKILHLKHIQIAGIGTNLSCYGGVLPTSKNMQKLQKIQKLLLKKGVRIPIISGGSSSSLSLVLNKKMPSYINQLRVGESFFTGCDTISYQPIKNLHQDVFTLQAQVIELKKKPSKPIGKVGYNAFGKKQKFKDNGVFKRAILNIGEASISVQALTPKDKNISILGASSDHLILDVSKNKTLNIGDILNFSISYEALLKLFHSLHVKKKYLL